MHRSSPISALLCTQTEKAHALRIVVENPLLLLPLFSADRVVDDLNPMLSFTRREVESLLHFVEEEPDVSQVQLQSRQEMEASIRQACQLYPHLVTKVTDHLCTHSTSDRPASSTLT
jgi:hypothetical protein